MGVVGSGMESTGVVVGAAGAGVARVRGMGCVWVRVKVSVRVKVRVGVRVRVRVRVKQRGLDVLPLAQGVRVVLHDCILPPIVSQLVDGHSGL
jgi:hypothetical protein